MKRNTQDISTHEQKVVSNIFRLRLVESREHEHTHFPIKVYLENESHWEIVVVFALKQWAVILCIDSAVKLKRCHRQINRTIETITRKAKNGPPNALLSPIFPSRTPTSLNEGVPVYWDPTGTSTKLNKQNQLSNSDYSAMLNEVKKTFWS